MKAALLGGLVASCVWAGATAWAGSLDYAVAEQAIRDGRHGEAIAILRPHLEAEAADARAAHLLGMAIFGKTDGEVSRLRADKVLRVDVLQPEQAESYRECLALFSRAAELAPDASFAPEAAFMAARVMDWGYLKRYDDARKAYRGVVERYPGTEAARKAADRIEYWNNLFKHGGTMPPGPWMQQPQ